jgi:hypothetical protein
VYAEYLGSTHNRHPTYHHICDDISSHIFKSSDICQPVPSILYFRVHELNVHEISWRNISITETPPHIEVTSPSHHNNFLCLTRQEQNRSLLLSSRTLLLLSSLNSIGPQMRKWWFIFDVKMPVVYMFGIYRSKALRVRTEMRPKMTNARIKPVHGFYLMVQHQSRHSTVSHVI